MEASERDHFKSREWFTVSLVAKKSSKMRIRRFLGLKIRRSSETLGKAVGWSVVTD